MRVEVESSNRSLVKIVTGDERAGARERVSQLIPRT